MSDLISREKTIKALRREAGKKHCNGFRDIAEGILDAIRFIEETKNIPTVDAVEVVRCKNCTRWGTGVAGETEHVKCCEFGRYMVGENGYCVYGELRSSAK